ncbi:hypothetical protein MNBD_NITROSPINAE02-1833 [hydrothermal vent metagenome]|uniref:Cytochrome oxidase subunit I profile domain-containing protein n=1 Tax=hydrothermal vent metagenome TaxID=652676 RepID=A0A3B1C5M6_9ZZZZ
MSLKSSFKSAATSWLFVAITAIIFMGAYVFMIVLSRTPGFNLLFTEQDFFRTALVTHVVLSIVIWFIAFIVFLMYTFTQEDKSGMVDQIMALGGLLGVLFIVATPFTGPASPETNNYVPTLNRPLYLMGLGLFFGSASLGFILRLPALVKSVVKVKSTPVIIMGALTLAGASVVIGVMLMVVAKFMLAGVAEMDQYPRLYYELLFWGGGHVLQFANTMGMVAGWSYITYRLTGKPPVNDKVAYIVLSVVAVFVFISPFQFFFLSIDSVEFRRFFTLLKNWGVSLGPIAAGIGILMLRARIKEDNSFIRRGLFLSMTLFAMGGLIALTISGSDTRVPAHYHGTIGGVTLCYMTMGLIAMVDNGWLDHRSKWLKAQVTLYGAGQATLVTGLFAGGLLGGLARKIYGQAQTLDSVEKIFSMAVMGAGGLLAITSGAIFAILMLKGLIKGWKTTEA